MAKFGRNWDMMYRLDNICWKLFILARCCGDFYDRCKAAVHGSTNKQCQDKAK